MSKILDMSKVRLRKEIEELDNETFLSFKSLVRSTQGHIDKAKLNDSVRTMLESSNVEEFRGKLRRILIARAEERAKEGFYPYRDEVRELEAAKDKLSYCLDCGSCNGECECEERNNDVNS